MPYTLINTLWICIEHAPFLFCLRSITPLTYNLVGWTVFFFFAKLEDLSLSTISYFSPKKKTLSYFEPYLACWSFSFQT